MNDWKRRRNAVEGEGEERLGKEERTEAGKSAEGH